MATHLLPPLAEHIMAGVLAVWRGGGVVGAVVGAARRGVGVNRS